LLASHTCRRPAPPQTIIKDDSNLTQFFTSALRPWVHYVPVGYNGIAEVDDAVKFLRENDALAREIGRNGQRFAQAHLQEEGRMCYIKVGCGASGVGCQWGGVPEGHGCQWQCEHLPVTPFIHHLLAHPPVPDSPAQSTPPPQVLFEELAKLQRYQLRLEDFPSPITYDDEVAKYVPQDVTKNHMGLGDIT